MIAGDDENIMGALMQNFQNLQRFRGTPRGGSVSPPQFSSAQLATQVGGSKENRLRAPLGLGSFKFTDNNPHTFVVEPQEAFRGERLIVNEVITDGAALGLVIDLITVGSLPQTPSVEFGLPASMFRPDATDAMMDWQICPAGTKIQISAHVEGTFGEAESLIAQLGLYGVWIRG